MKKTYIRPELEMVKFDSNTSIAANTVLSGSLNENFIHENDTVVEWDNLFK